MNKGQVQEALVTLYLRLNGYFTTGFIVHSPIHGRNRTEVNILGVRFPHNAEPARGVGAADELETTNELVDFVIGDPRGEPEGWRQIERGQRVGIRDCDLVHRARCKPELRRLTDLGFKDL